MSVHALLRRGAEIFLGPLDALGGFAVSVVVGALAGVVALLVLRICTSPAGVRRDRQRVQSELLALRLYGHDLSVVADVQRELFAAIGRYAGRMLLPFAVAALPIGLLFAQLDARYGYQPVAPGAAVLLRAESTGSVEGWELRSEGGLRIEAGPVRVAARRELWWRLAAETPGRATLRLLKGEAAPVVMGVDVASAPSATLPLRSAPGLESWFTAPTLPALEAATGLVSLSIDRPRGEVSVGAWQLHWLWPFLLSSLVAALLLKRRLGVEI